MFYGDSVVGNNTYYMYTKMGGRIHRTSRYNAHMCVYNHINIYKISIAIKKNR